MRRMVYTNFKYDSGFCRFAGLTSGSGRIVMINYIMPV